MRMSSSREAREPDHLAREVDDLHRLAHVEHEDLAALAHQPGLQHELRRLRDRHEVALDVGMRDGDRAAARDLLAEVRHHAAGRAEHVAEAHDHELRCRCRRCSAWQTISARRLEAPITLVGFTALSVEISTNFAAPCLRAARATAMVDSTLLRTASKALSLLHQRHVLVRRGMEHDLRPVAREHLAHARARPSRRRSPR